MSVVWVSYGRAKNSSRSSISKRSMKIFVSLTTIVSIRLYHIKFFTNLIN